MTINQNYAFKKALSKVEFNNFYPTCNDNILNEKCRYCIDFFFFLYQFLE
jgi:hypothetical protein